METAIASRQRILICNTTLSACYANLRCIVPFAAIAATGAGCLAPSETTDSVVQTEVLTPATTSRIQQVGFRTDSDGEPMDGLVGVATAGHRLEIPHEGMPVIRVVTDLLPPPTIEERGISPTIVTSDVQPTFVERQIQMFNAQNPEEVVRVLIGVDTPAFDWRALGRTGRDTTQRDALIQERRRQVEAATAPLMARLTAFGAQDIAAGDLSAVIAARITARQALDVAAWPDVRSIQRDEPRGRLAQYGGDQARQGMRTANFQNNGITGNGPGRAGGRTRYAVVDLENTTNSINDWPYWNHDGYQRTVSYIPLTTQTRWSAVRDCLSAPCNLFPGGYSTWPSGNPSSHANFVARTLTGSIENSPYGSFSAFDRRQRSGISTEGDLFYYRVDGSSYSLATAVDRLIIDNIDVANMSIGIPCTPVGCHLDCDTGTTNASIENATSAGVLIVAAIGNDGGTTCRAMYPAMNRNTLAVAGLETTSTTNYDTSTLWAASSRGGMDVLTTSGGTQRFAIADLAAPAFWTYSYQPTISSFTTGGGFIGTSFAAPAVAATAGLLREAFNTIGWNLNDARTLLVNMILLGDGYQDYAGIKTSFGMDVRSGAGRVHAHAPITGDMVSPWGWGWHVARLGPGQVLTFPVWDAGPEDPNVQQWKGAMTWLEPSSPGSGSTIPVADIVLEVWDTCAPGGAVSVSSDYSFDIRKRLSLTHSQIVLPTRSRCLEGRVRVFDVPAGSPNPLAPTQPRTRDVYVADYFHSGNPNDH